MGRARLSDEERRERRRAKRKRYREKHKEELKVRRKEQRKEYRQAHKEQISEYNAKYREEHGLDKHCFRKTGISPNASVFALYKGDEFIDIGTKYDLAEKYGLTPDYIYWASSPSGKKSFYAHGATGYTSVNLTLLEREEGNL